jgi:hypothetical protein
MKFQVDRINFLDFGSDDFGKRSDFDYMDLYFSFGAFSLNLQFFFFPVANWSWEWRNIGHSCFLFRHTQFDIVLPTLEFKYQHFYEKT